MGADGTRIAVTGHRQLADEDSAHAVVEELLRRLPRPLICVSELAAGADQLVARAVLEAGGTLEVVLPAEGYEASLPPRARAGLDSLRKAASSVTRLPHPAPGPAAYADAARRMLERANLLIAVWDRGPSRGVGGTADVVRMARDRGIPVRVIPAERARPLDESGED